MSYTFIKCCPKRVPHRDRRLVRIFLILEKKRNPSDYFIAMYYFHYQPEWRATLEGLTYTHVHARTHTHTAGNHEHLTGKGGTLVLSSGIKTSTSAWPWGWRGRCSLCQSCYSLNKMGLPTPVYQAECYNTMWG